MNTQNLFTETQKFRQAWLIILLIIVNAIFLFGFFKQVVFGFSFGTKPMSNLELYISNAMLLLFSAIFFFIKMETIITHEGIHVRVFPLHLKYQFIAWGDIEKAYIRQYSPIGEFGGWGIRYGFGKKGKAYNVSGNMGLQLELKNNKRLLIGTQKSEEIAELIKQFNF